MTSVPEWNNFIFVKSTTTNDVDIKRPGWSKKTFEKEYDTYGDEEAWVEKDMKDQIWSTVSSLDDKPLKDKEIVYLVLGIESHVTTNGNPLKIKREVFYKETMDVLKSLSAQVLCYLDSNHTRLLIACPMNRLTRILNKTKYHCAYFKGIKRIGPLLPEEQISESLSKDQEWLSNSRDVLIELVPNLSVEKREEYSKAIAERLKNKENDTVICSDKDLLVSQLNAVSTKQLLNECNFVFRISEVPIGILQDVSIKRKRAKSTKSQSIEATGASLQSTNTLPTICVLDSGVSSIPQLNGILIHQDGYKDFDSFEDDYGQHGHGTPVAYLAAFGENNNPKARIISYKVYSDKTKSVYPDAYKLAIQKYSSVYHPQQTKIFVSSIVFRDYNPIVTARIDRWIQENNICAIFSAGNIEKNVMYNYAKNGIPASSYIHLHPTLDPAQVLNGITVGSIAKKEASDSLVQAGDLSPFTRCGTNNSCLYDCIKPELVQHGGNCCIDKTQLGLSSACMNGATKNDFIGTSFAAPILANHIVEIESMYGEKIKNAESFKAIAVALSDGDLKICRGFGEMKPIQTFDFGLQALVCSEGEIPLPDSISDDKYRTDHSATITVGIPNNVNCVKLFIVHSDNHFKEANPHLNTYLKVKATKIPRDSGNVELKNPSEVDRRSNIKSFIWSFPSHPMGGIWTFTITPQVVTDMLAEHKRDTVIRYGCVILINSKINARAKPLSLEVLNLNRQIGALA